MAKRRVAILISGRGTNMAALIAAAKDQNYPAEIVLVLSNRPDAGGLAHARAAGIATAIVDHQAFGKDRAAFEAAVQARLDAHAVELVCLAGFMRLLTDAFVERWSGRMINIHPALLPSFKGLHTHARALEAGVKIHGATVHFVVPEVDSGPIIAQAAVPVCDGDTPDTLAARVLAAELRVYPLALALVAGGRATLTEGLVRNAATVSPAAQLIVPDLDQTDSAEVAANGLEQPAAQPIQFDRTDEQINALATDPAIGNRITPNTIQERTVGLGLEARGDVPGPIIRDPSGNAEFIDSTGQAWDVKGLRSNFPDRTIRSGRDVSGRPIPVKKGGFSPARAADTVNASLEKGENVMLDTTNMTPADVAELRREGANFNWGDRVKWWP